MLSEVTCPHCGKKFIRAAQNIYKDRGRHFCSWTCYNHRNDNKTSPAKVVEQYTLEGVLIQTFPSTIIAADAVYGTADGVRKACRESTLYKGYSWRYKK